MNPALILFAIQHAATAVEGGKALLKALGVVGDGSAPPANPDAEVPGLPGITEGQVHEAIAKGRAAVQELGATADAILERLKAEGKLP